MPKSVIEIIFEECGWKYSAREKAWRLANFRVIKEKLHLALEEGKGPELREKIIEVISEVEDPSPEDLANIEATVERLKIKNKKK